MARHSPLVTRHFRVGSPPLPREHGGWATLAVPWVVGLGASGHFGGAGVLLGISALFVFLARHPLARLLQPRGRALSIQEKRLLAYWTGIYAGLALACGLLLIALWRRTLLVDLGLAAAGLLAFDLAVGVRERLQRTTVHEMIIVSGLCLTAPGTYYAETGRMGAVGFWLWLLCALYFWGTVFYVKAQAEGRRSARTRLGRLGPFGRFCLAFSLATPVMVLVLAVGHFPAVVAVAYLPAALKAGWATLLGQARAPVLRDARAAGARASFVSRPMTSIGLAEVAHAILFATLLIVLYRR